VGRTNIFAEIWKFLVFVTVVRLLARRFRRRRALSWR